MTTTYKNALSEVITKLKKKDNSVIRVLEGNRYVVYHYSSKRERKDLYEIQRAIKKAEYLTSNPSKRARAKYLKITTEKTTVNTELIKKHTFLAGIKSYKTNMDISPELVVERYSDLWKVEKAFRMTKSDLKARPIFHRKEDPIKAHMQVVFAANAVSKHIEFNTHKSIKQIVKEIMKKIEVKFKLKISDTIITLPFTPH